MHSDLTFLLSDVMNVKLALLLISVTIFWTFISVSRFDSLQQDLRSSRAASSQQSPKQFSSELAHLCGVSDPQNIANITYESYSPSLKFRFFLSLHDSAADHVVSKGIKEGLYGSKEKYPSVTEIHTICQYSNRLRKGEQYTVDCGHGKVFVEVGSAIGMVSLYAATRGMNTYAFDPLEPNINRTLESLCLNGVFHCVNRQGVGYRDCREHPDYWGNFAPKNFRVSWNLVDSEPKETGRLVESAPGNLAATLGGGGSYRAVVNVTSIDEAVKEDSIEMMLITCQGCELYAIQGAQDLIQAGKVRNIIWRLHQPSGPAGQVTLWDKDYEMQRQHAEASKIVEFLLGVEYEFYDVEPCRQSGAPPVWIPPFMIMNHVLRTRAAGAHPNVLASLKR